VNLYGKGIRPGRKLGHVNVSGDDLDEVRRRAIAAAALLRGESAPLVELVETPRDNTEEEANA
jgi:5-(carboxyamino)imidazole ribonucleotide synthase